MSPQQLKGAVAVVMLTAIFATSFAAVYKVFGGGSSAVAFLATMAPMGLLRFVQQVHGFGTPAYFQRLRDWEHSAARQRKLGVLAWAWTLRHSPLRWLNSLVYLRRRPESPAFVLAQVQAAEACHFWAFFAALPYLAYAVLHTWWTAVLVVCVVQVFGNVYPYLHLRYTRARLSGFIIRSTERAKGRTKALRATDQMPS